MYIFKLFQFYVAKKLFFQIISKEKYKIIQFCMYCCCPLGCLQLFADQCLDHALSFSLLPSLFI